MHHVCQRIDHLDFAMTQTAETRRQAGNRSSWKALAALLALYFVTTLGWGAINPLFEAPDENHHYFTARAIGETWTLPTADIDSPARQEAAQPPLYYLLAALLATPFGLTDDMPKLWLNSHELFVDDGLFVNVNKFVHGATEQWPWRGWVLGAHVIRLFSTMLGAGTLICIFATARCLWPGDGLLALTATGLVAGLPQFGFLHGAITNDTLVIFLCSLALYILMRGWLDGFRPAHGLALGSVAGLAVLSKMTGLVLSGYLLGALMVNALLFVRTRSTLGIIGLFSAMAVLICGWLLWRNFLLYGDPTATRIFIDFAGGERRYSLGVLRAEWGTIWRSTIGVFGWLAPTAPDWVLWTWVGIAGAGLLGAIGATINKLHHAVAGGQRLSRAINSAEFALQWRRTTAFVLLALWPAAIGIAWLHFIWRTPANQGRLIFPALLPLGLGVAWGLTRLLRPWLAAVALTVALLTSFYTVFVFLPPVYRQPRVVAAADIPSGAAHFGQIMQPGVELVAADVPPQSLHPGDVVRATLYWRKTTDEQAIALVAPEIVGRAYHRIGSLPLSYHGSGLFPNILWPDDVLWPGEGLIEQQLALPIDEATAAPVEGKLLVRLDGQEPLLQVGSVKIVPAVWPTVTGVILANFAREIDLMRAELSADTINAGDELTLDLTWVATAAPQADYTVFIHLGDPQSAPLAQADSRPMQGEFATPWWAQGDVIDDQHHLTVPAELGAGTYPINIGLYDLQNDLRAPAFVNQARLPNDALTIGFVTVVTH